MIDVYESELLNLYSHKVKHAFFTRNGGISKDNYKSLNLGFNTNDSELNVQYNRKIIAKYFNIDYPNLVILNQTHSNKVITISKNNYAQSLTGDALVTNEPNLALGVLTADCTPILIADIHNNIIAAIHAGWRSSYSGIIQNTINSMKILGANNYNMIAIIGPTIGQKNYEVDADFKNNFVKINQHYNNFFTKQDKQDKFLFNLSALNLYQLEQLEVKASNLNLCTYEKSSEFFSYRRSIMHENKTDCGRQISAIMLQKT